MKQIPVAEADVLISYGLTLISLVNGRRLLVIDGHNIFSNTGLQCGQLSLVKKSKRWQPIRIGSWPCHTSLPRHLIVSDMIDGVRLTILIALLGIDTTISFVKGRAIIDINMASRDSFVQYNHPRLQFFICYRLIAVVGDRCIISV